MPPFNYQWQNSDASIQGNGQVDQRGSPIWISGLPPDDYVLHVISHNGYQQTLETRILGYHLASTMILVPRAAVSCI